MVWEVFGLDTELNYDKGCGVLDASQGMGSYGAGLETGASTELYDVFDEVRPWTTRHAGVAGPVLFLSVEVGSFSSLGETASRPSSMLPIACKDGALFVSLPKKVKA